MLIQLNLILRLAEHTARNLEFSEPGFNTDAQFRAVCSSKIINASLRWKVSPDSLVAHLQSYLFLKKSEFNY